jgi:putative ABC transport system substrate-binding protein
MPANPSGIGVESQAVEAAPVGRDILKRRQLLFAGCAAALGAVAHAQAPRKYRLGVFGLNSHEAFWAGDLDLILDELGRLGYQRGVRLEVFERFGRTEDELNRLAKELVAIPVGVFLIEGTIATLAAQRATKAIPIVAAVGDPVASGFARSLQKPSGNITGFQNRSGLEKEVELLCLLLPGASRVAIPWNESERGAEDIAKRLAEAYSRAGFGVSKFPHAPGALGKKLEELKGPQIDAVHLAAETLMKPEDLAIAIKHRIALIGKVTQDVERGALMCVDNDASGESVRVAAIIDKVFRGQKPADIPFEQPSRLYASVNAKTAAALGIRLTQEIRLRLDRVIE